MNFKQKFQKNRSNSGITLVVLIITIVLLIIIATVTIRGINGDGILGHAKNAEENFYTKSNNLESRINELNQNE